MQNICAIKFRILAESNNKGNEYFAGNLPFVFLYILLFRNRGSILLSSSLFSLFLWTIVAYFFFISFTLSMSSLFDYFSHFFYGTFQRSFHIKKPNMDEWIDFGVERGNGATVIVDELRLTFLGKLQ
jgi:hypothetical protein